MSAKLGSNVKWNGKYMFGSRAMTALPEHGALVAATIGSWSVAEANLGRVFAALIGAKQPVSMSMYSAVRSFEVQRDLLKTASKEILSKRYAAMMFACVDVMYKLSLTRHQFAHGVWSVSTDRHLQALLLIDSKTFWNVYAERLRFSNTRVVKSGKMIEGSMEFIGRAPRLNLSDILVYELNDLRKEHERMERAYRIADAMHRLVVSDTRRRRVIYPWLYNEPDLLSALNKVKKTGQKLVQFSAHDRVNLRESRTEAIHDYYLCATRQMRPPAP